MLRRDFGPTNNARRRGQRYSLHNFKHCRK